MALWRLMKNSVRFAFRAKRRWITFVIIFAFLSAFITLFIGAFNQYGTDNLLDQKGFYIETLTEGSVTEAEGDDLALALNAIEEVETVALYRYFDLGDYIRVYGVDPASRWMFAQAKPSYLINGKYISQSDEALVSKNASVKADVGTLIGNVSASIQKGDKLIFENTTRTELTIVGEIQDQISTPGKLKIIVTDEAFDELHTSFSNGQPIYAHSIAVLVKGNLYAPFNKEIFNNMNALNDPADSDLYDLITNSVLYGFWDDPYPTNPDGARKDRTQRFLYFIIGIVGGVLLTILYNFLIVWFRRREVAVLRAMGYEKGEIRISLVGESLTISFVGYVIGILAIIIYFAAAGMTFTNQLLTGTTILISFGIVVVLTIPGLLLSSLSFVRVSPVILFKAR